MRRISRGSNGLGISEPGPKSLRLAAVEPARHRVRRRIARELRDRVDGGMFHFLVDPGGADVERAAEDERETQDVVDLVREVGTPGADHRVGARLARLVRHDFRVRIGQRHHQRLVRHRLDHLGLQHIRRGKPQEDIGAADHIGQHARIGLLGVDRLPAVHQRVAALMHHAIDVADPDVLALRAHRYQQVEARDRGRTGARADDLHIRQLLAVQQQRIDDGGAHDDGRAMLVVVEHRDLHALFKLRLDLEALRSLDVLEIDAAEGRFQRRHRLDHALDGVGGDLDVEDVDAGEFLEQDRLAFHDGLRGQGADIAKPQHRGTVGDHGDQIGPGGQRRRFGWIVGDFGAGRSDPGRIGQREVALVGERLGRLDLEFAGPRQPMIRQRRGAEIFRIGRHALPHGLSRPRITSGGRSSFEPSVLRQIEPDVKHGQPHGCNIRKRPHQQGASTESAKAGSIISSLPRPLYRHVAILPPANVGVRSTTNGKDTDGPGRCGRDRGGWLLRLRVLHPAPDRRRSRDRIRADSRGRRQGEPRQGVVRPEEPNRQDCRHRD